MRKITVQVFAADPLSSAAGGSAPRLMLDEEVRRMRETVRAADYRDAVEFDVRWAARSDDLLQAMNEVTADVVHFSGHGGSHGLVLVGDDGRSHAVGAEGLARLFSVFGAETRIVVLNACLSLPQAEAIAEVVGCAIGTRSTISDAAAVTFAGSFYRAIAFGHSVGRAFEQACAALALKHPLECECPQLVARSGVDPATLVLLPPPVARRPAAASPVALPPPRWWRLSRTALAGGAGALTLGVSTWVYGWNAGQAPPSRDGQARPAVAAAAQQEPRRVTGAADPPHPPPSSRTGEQPRVEPVRRPAGPPSSSRPQRGVPEVSRRPRPPRDPDAGTLAFAPQALAEARAEFARGEYQPALRRLDAALQRLEVLDRQFPNSQPVRSMLKQIAAQASEVRTACETDAAVQKAEAKCT
ncbi:CHAT domain-containing protein [Longimicrobium terrae]|uniref:CHAT domain-containing protein n=1 Tax=Longimicrobium terrae TaxID=1639882 RepID=A0A841H033_9BACT|nr:CHAT domain-containing protein [Longimicrobium terrae]MBB4637078.1 hypothetical protein [Longimicrobium terrae]MBB6071314.1 hypothetical protein [Longimicrobium terrae]NNC31467.1 CHAT domain-containing protein [Longimicrobium terrae]